MAHPPTSLTSFERPRELLIAAGVLALALMFCGIMVWFGPRSDFVLDGMVWLALPLLLAIWVVIRRFSAARAIWAMSVADFVAALGTYAWFWWLAATVGEWNDFFGARVILGFLVASVGSVYVWRRHPHARTRGALWGALAGIVLGLGLGAWVPGIRVMMPFDNSPLGQFVCGLTFAYLGGITLHAWVLAISDQIRKPRAASNHQRHS